MNARLALFDVKMLCLAGSDNDIEDRVSLCESNDDESELDNAGMTEPIDIDVEPRDVLSVDPHSESNRYVAKMEWNSCH